MEFDISMCTTNYKNNWSCYYFNTTQKKALQCPLVYNEKYINIVFVRFLQLKTKTQNVIISIKQRKKLFSL